VSKTDDAEVAAITPALIERAGGQCELKIPGVCMKGMSRTLPLCAHHRKLRKHGGSSTLENLLWLCAGCHRWVHDYPQTSYGEGWLVHSWAAPEDVPVEAP
jgi:5-methylcytosine-specific restriction endonuclease McrA